MWAKKPPATFTRRPDTKIQMVKKYNLKTGWLAGWGLVASLCLLAVVIGSQLVSADRHSHAEFDLDRCQIKHVESNASDRRLGVSDTSLYVCGYEGDGGDAQRRSLSLFCIPFVSGDVDFQRYSGVGELQVKTSRYGSIYEYPILLRRGNVQPTSGSLISCNGLAGLKDPMIVCTISRNGASVPNFGEPFSAHLNRYCVIRATHPDPPEVDPQGNSSYPLDDCQVSSVSSANGGYDFYKCIYDSTEGYGVSYACLTFLRNGGWQRDGSQVGAYRYSVDVRGAASIGCDDLKSRVGGFPGVDSDTISFIVACGSDLFSGGDTHPVEGEDLGFCSLGIAWESSSDSTPTDSSAGPVFSEPDGEKFEDTIECTTDDCGFLATVNSILGWMAYLVVPIVTIVIIVGGVQLSLAGDSPEGTKKAKMRITQGIVALICYILLWSVLRWLI